LAGPAGTGRICDAAAVWRGAFLAQGSLTEPGRSPALEVRCPGSEAATGLVGTARRLGVTARTREVEGAHRVVVRDGAAIGVLLSAMGAPRVRARWQQRRMRRQELRGAGTRLAVFDEANLRRTEHAAGAAAAPHTGDRSVGKAADAAMATDYDAPRHGESDAVVEESLQVLQERHREAQSPAVDVEETDTGEGFELPGGEG